MIRDLHEYERWNQRFSAQEYVFGTRPNAFLTSQEEILAAGTRALCVADGEGRNSVWLAGRGLEVTAFDFSPSGVAKAKKLAALHDVAVDYRLSDVNDWDWKSGDFDVVVAIFVQFASPEERTRMFSGMVQTLKRGGLLILQGYRPAQLAYATGGPKKVENLYTEELLRDSFSSLEILHLSSHDAVLDEGPGHSGMSALIDLVARK